MKVPLFVSLRGYQSGWLRGDVLAGLTVLSGRGIALFLARDVGQVRDVLRRSHPDDSVGEGQIFATVEEAVEAASKATPQEEARS